MLSGNTICTKHHICADLFKVFAIFLVRTEQMYVSRTWLQALMTDFFMVILYKCHAAQLMLYVISCCEAIVDGNSLIAWSY